MAVQEISKAQASEYNHVVAVDASGSMGGLSKRLPGKTRWEEVREHITGMINFLSDVDEDGIDIVFFSGESRVHQNVKTPEQVEMAFKNERPGGGTNLAAAFDKIDQIRLAKGGPYFVHVFTDGEPQNEGAARDAIARMVKSMKKDSDLAISFLQVGDDPVAAKFLKGLDDDLQKSHKLEFDAVNTLTVQEAEGLSYEQIMWLALND